MPRHGETITIQTWSNKFVRFQAERSFFMFDEAGNKILDGMSRWVFMDLEKRKPTNVPKEMAERCHGGQEPAILDEKFLVPKQAQGELLCTRALVVTRRDTDTNGHANNVKYLEWAMDDLPDAIYDEMDLKDIRIVYRKECMRGDRVELKTFVQDTDGGKEVFRFVSDGPGQANLPKSSEKFMKKVSGKLFMFGEFKVIDVCSKCTFVVCSKAYIGNVLVGRSCGISVLIIVGSINKSTVHIELTHSTAVIGGSVHNFNCVIIFPFGSVFELSGFIGGSCENVVAVVLSEAHIHREEHGTDFTYHKSRGSIVNIKFDVIFECKAFAVCCAHIKVANRSHTAGGVNAKGFFANIHGIIHNLNIKA